MSQSTNYYFYLHLNVKEQQKACSTISFYSTGKNRRANLAELLKTDKKRVKRRKEYKPQLLGAIIPLENNTHPPAFFIFSLALFVRLGFYLPPKGFPSSRP
jgi:hypothetical protein